jgi:hypothetical protein
MTSEEVASYVKSQIGDHWAESNHHGVNLRKSLVMPRKVQMINRIVKDGAIKDSIVEVWIVLEEHPGEDGYTIFFDEDDHDFGLASKGFPADQHLVICGYYGDFWTTLKGM